jgi:hypothetical protein
MTIDLIITKGRFNNSIRGITDKGISWVKETFDFNIMGSTMFSGDDSDYVEVVTLAKKSGLDVEER